MDNASTENDGGASGEDESEKSKDGRKSPRGEDVEKGYPDLPPREQVKRLVEINEEADVTVDFTALYGLLFESILKISKVSSILEVGRRIARKNTRMH